MEFVRFLSDLCGQFEDENTEIHESDKLADMDTWDSLTAMAVLYMIEKNYGVLIPAEDFVNLKTPREIFEYVQERSVL
jgi:acyl carrier protein